MKNYKRRFKNKSFDWYGLSQRFSIRKYHFGAASVLLGTALILGHSQGAVKAEETGKTLNGELVADNPEKNLSIDSSIPVATAKSEVLVETKTELDPASVLKPVSEKETEKGDIKTVDKSEIGTEALPKSSTETSDKQIEKVKNNQDKKVADEKQEVKQLENVANTDMNKNDVASLKTTLTQLTSEAEVLNATASNFAEKKVEDKVRKEAIAVAVASAKAEIASVQKSLETGKITKIELDNQFNRISSAIEAVYTEMKRGGHAGKIEAVLSGEPTSQNNLIIPPRTKTPVQNLDHLSEEEIAAIKHEMMNSNPSITDPSMIRVEASGRGVTGNVVVTVNGVETRIISGDVIVGTSGTKNLEQLKYSINWFDFASSTITYPDGTVVGEARKLAQPITRTLTYPNGDQVEGKITMVRDVTYTDGTKGLTTDEKFLNSGITRYVEHLYGDGNAQNNHELYEVLQEGMKFNVKTKVKGYVLTATVMKLAPKDVKTDPKRTEAGPINSLRQDAGGPLITKVGNDRRADVLLTAQDKQWSYLRKAGFQTTNPDGSEMLTAFSPSRDTANVGITFALSATYNSRPVDVNVIAADAEEANDGEVVQFVTDGTKWKSFMEVNQQRDIDARTARPAVPMNENQLSGLTRGGYNPKEWVNLDETENPTVYGTHTFGPNKTSLSGVHSLPIAFSQSVKTLSLYLNSLGAQAGTFGFMIYDGGDAPESYGEAFHAIGDFNKEKNGQQVTATQPYLGDQPGDPDFRSTASDPNGLWLLDDLVHTEKYEEIGVKIGDKISNGLGDTGTLDKVDGVWVIRKSSVETIALKQGDIVSINKPKEGKNTATLDDIPVRGLFNAASQTVSIGALPDEGEAQLIDGKTGIREYTLRQATDSEYVLEGIKVHRGVNNDSAYVRAWVDFNNNGKFDQFESSEVLHVQEDGTVNISFKNTPQLLTTSIDSIGVRVRIGLDEKEILSPTGIASSGEVEDFLTHVVHFPRGIRNFSKGYQGQKQELNIPTNAMFAAQGKTKDSNYKDWNQIETTIAPKFVITESSVASTEETGKDVNITLNGTTVYGGKEVILKDAAGHTLATAIKVTNHNSGKSEYLTSEYTEYDKDGKKVGVYTLNPESQDGRNIDGPGGLRYTKVTFKPELGYVGTAKGVAIRAWDKNRNSTGWELTATTIEQAKKDPNLSEKDRITENVNKEINGRLSMDSIFIPTVVDIKPVDNEVSTTDEQGKKQSAILKFSVHRTITNGKSEESELEKISKDLPLIDKTKKPTFVIPGRRYLYDTKVREKTILTYENGETEIFQPLARIPRNSILTQKNPFEITGLGGVRVYDMLIDRGTVGNFMKVPVGSVLEGTAPTTSAPVTVLRNGVEVIVPAGGRLQTGDQLVTPLEIVDENQVTTWTVTLQKGDIIPKVTSTNTPRLYSNTDINKLLGTIGDTITIGRNTYVNYRNVIPKGTKIKGEKTDSNSLNGISLPSSYFLNPETDEFLGTSRKYTLVRPEEEVIDGVVYPAEIVIENEGTYTLKSRFKINEKGEKIYEDAEIVFTPDPNFVGVGIGVTIRQGDIDYPTTENPDKVTKEYGTDYGIVRYVPIVTPKSTATITRKIHYVYEGDKTTAPKDKTSILRIDGKPVINEQTLSYKRDYTIVSKKGPIDKDITVGVSTPLLTVDVPVERYEKNEQTGEVTKIIKMVDTVEAGDVIKAGTVLEEGDIIIGAWKPINPENDMFTSIISPTIKGYTAEVQLPVNEYTKKEQNGVQTHVRSTNSTPVGIYTPTIKDGEVNTKDVGAYDPLVSAVTADNRDDFDVYVYYKADKQVARVVYIDMDATNNDKQGILETHTGSTMESKAATVAGDSSVVKKEELNGESATRIKYSTAATIAKYEAMGYELKRDGFTNDDNGVRIVGGRKFDEESVEDSEKPGEKPQNQTFYVFLGHKRDTGAKIEEESVTRTINYKYKKDDSKAAESVTETLNFRREITIDMALAAKEFPAETAIFNAENTKATQKEKDDAQRAYEQANKAYTDALELVKEDVTTATALSTAEKALVIAERTLLDAKKASAAIVLAVDATKTQQDAKTAAQEAVQAAQTAYDNALSNRDAARTNYLAANNADLAKKVVEAQQLLDSKNLKVEIAKAEYEAKVKETTSTEEDKATALTKLSESLVDAKAAAEQVSIAKKKLEVAQNDADTLKDTKEAEETKNTDIQNRPLTTDAAKQAARQAYYDAVIAKVKEASQQIRPIEIKLATAQKAMKEAEAVLASTTASQEEKAAAQQKLMEAQEAEAAAQAELTPLATIKNKISVVNFGSWIALGSTATNLPTNEPLTEAEKLSDNAFNKVTSSMINGYLADKVSIDRTDAIDPLAADYSVDVFYVQGEQRATIKFVEVDPTNTDTIIAPGVAADLVEIGKSGDNFAALTTDTVAATIKKLQDKGYTLVSNGFANPGEGVNNTTFDNDPAADQEFVVKVKATVVDVPSFDPTKPESNENPKPIPGVTPIDPQNPSGPKWTEDLIKAVKVQEEVTRTIKYVYEDGTEVPADKLTDVADKKVKTLTFTRPGKINVVTGKITYGDWSANQTFEAVTSPTINNYPATVVGATPGTTVVPAKEVSATAMDFEEVVIYKKNIITDTTQVAVVHFVDVDGKPVYTSIVEAGNAGTKFTKANEVTNIINKLKTDGYTIIENKANQNPYPDEDHRVFDNVDDKGENGISQVYYVTVEAKKPPVVVTDTQKATVKYVVEGTNTVLHTDELTGKSGEAINYSTATKLEDLKVLGYELVSDGFTTATDKNFDNNTTVDQNFTVTVKEKIVTVKPFDPANPNDPNTPKPGDPIDPKNPNGPKWTKELIDKLETTKHVTRTISYIDENDHKVTSDVTDKVTFTRELQVNVVTREIVNSNVAWTSNDTTFDEVVSPVVQGYILKDANQKVVAETKGLTEISKDETIKVVYVKLGSWIPKVPEGATPVPPITYPNDPTDPTKPGTDKPKVPYVPGFIPVDPEGQPLKPVDPQDPSKGYEVPDVPADPSKDTPIYYVTDKQKAITNFVDNNGKVVTTPVVDEGDSGTKFTKSGEVESKIRELVQRGYVVISNDYPSADTDRVFDNDKDKDQIFNVKVTPLIVPTDPNSPDKPQVPTDPTKPVGPNNPLKPVTPSTPEPGKPVFPEDPNSPVWPESVKDLVTETTATRTITYVDQNGKPVAATHTETIKFKRSAKVNLVTGEIIYGDWTVVGDDTILDGNQLPKVDGYIARGGDIDASQEDIKATAGMNITQTVVYDKLGSWVPKVPEGATPVPPITYPNDPTDPTKPGTAKPRVPHVPGFIPVDPNGNPLKPVDPNDPTKGYEVPDVPADPTQDTPIKYVPVTPEKPTPTPVVPVQPEGPNEQSESNTPKYADGQNELPNTGTKDHADLATLGLLGALSGFGLVARKKREDEK